MKVLKWKASREFPSVQGFSAEYQNHEIAVSLYYDHDTDRPLTLRGEAEPEELCELRIRPYRIELWVCGCLRDEEWPWGTCQADFEAAGLPVQEVPEEEVCLPQVMSTFRNAEGWLPGSGVFVGDCMPYVNGGRYHVLYLKDRHHHTSKWNRGAHQWEHISTEDFVTWKVHPMAVPIDAPWEASICTGSFMEAEGRYWLYYTIRTVDGSPAPICRSVSEDGYHFQKDRDFSFTLSEKYRGSSARDPKVFAGEDGKYHMFVTTTRMADGRGCLAHLVSADAQQWEETEPIYVSADENEPECSDYFACGGCWYLVYSLKGKGYYRYSKKPFTDWQDPEEPLIPCKRVPKAGILRGEIIFTGFSSGGEYGGTMTFCKAVPAENGELIFL